MNGYRLDLVVKFLEVHMNLFSVDCIDFAFDGDYNLIKYTRTN